MPTLKTTLPESVRDVVRRGDVAEIKVVLSEYEPMARFEARPHDTVLHLISNPSEERWALPDDVVVWMVQRGADINAVSGKDVTPLRLHALLNRPEQMALFVDLGARLHGFGDVPPPLFGAVSNPLGVEALRELVRLGADVNEVHQGQTPLDAALSNLTVAFYESRIPILEELLALGARPTPAVPQLLAEMDEQYDHERPNFQYDEAEAYADERRKIHSLFGWTPHNWRADYRELWKELVPPFGQAETVQGEAIRVIGRIGSELLNNGAMNWDDQFELMSETLGEYLASGTPLPPKQAQQADALCRFMSEDSMEPDINRLTQLVVRWVQANPEPVPLRSVPYMF